MNQSTWPTCDSRNASTLTRWSRTELIPVTLKTREGLWTIDSIILIISWPPHPNASDRCMDDFPVSNFYDATTPCNLFTISALKYNTDDCCWHYRPGESGPDGPGWPGTSSSTYLRYSLNLKFIRFRERWNFKVLKHLIQIDIEWWTCGLIKPIQFNLNVYSTGSRQTFENQRKSIKPKDWITSNTSLKRTTKWPLYTHLLVAIPPLNDNEAWSFTATTTTTQEPTTNSWHLHFELIKLHQNDRKVTIALNRSWTGLQW